MVCEAAKASKNSMSEWSWEGGQWGNEGKLMAWK